MEISSRNVRSNLKVRRGIGSKEGGGILGTITVVWSEAGRGGRQDDLLINPDLQTAEQSQFSS